MRVAAMSRAMSKGSTSKECESDLAATTFCSSWSSLLHAPQRGQRGKLCRRAGPFPLLSHARLSHAHTFLTASSFACTKSDPSALLPLLLLPLLPLLPPSLYVSVHTDAERDRIKSQECCGGVVGGCRANVLCFF